jgi:hypothetical protein
MTRGARPIGRLAMLLALVVPAYLLAAIAEDSLLGDALFIADLEWGGKRRLIRTLLETAIEAAPLLLVLAILVFAAARLVERRLRPNALLGLGSAALVSALLGLVLVRTPFLALPAMVLTGVVLFVVDYALGKWLGDGRSGAIGLLLLISLSTRPAHAEEHVLLIGGGYEPHASQVQIELNVRWLEKLLAKRKPNAPLETYFTAGGRPDVVDVFENLDPAKTGTASEPLARLFGVVNKNGHSFFRSRVEGLSGGTDKAALVARITALLKGLGQQDQLLFVYNGHGYSSPDDTAHNALRLWGDQHLDVVELTQLLDLAPPGVRIRAFFPQCYAGAFARMIRPGAADTRALTDRDRCGFFAQDEQFMAEGCTPSIDTDNYRDYTTYFFSALDGRTRSGGPLAFDPDRNHDGVVTLREAHLYSLVASDSADLPRSTSEAFLERWQPWYLRFTAIGEAPRNVYGELATELAHRMIRGVAGQSAVRTAHEMRREAEEAQTQIAARRAKLKEEIEKLEQPLRAAFEDRFPGAMVPYTRAFAQFYAKDLGPANRFIASQPAYVELKAKQDEDQRLEWESLEQLRRARTIQRWFRLRHLALLWDRFDHLASSSERSGLARILACEETPL